MIEHTITPTIKQFRARVKVLEAALRAAETALIIGEPKRRDFVLDLIAHVLK